MILSKILAGLFSVLFVGILLSLLGGMCWYLATLVEKGCNNTALKKQANRPPTPPLSDGLARTHMKELRDRADKARLERLKRRRKIEHAALDHIKFLEQENDGSEVDLTGELFEEAKCVIARKPLTGETEFFMALLPGRGARLNPRFAWSPFRSLSQKMTLSQATALLPLLPGGTRELFILTEETNETQTQAQALAEIKS